MFATSTAAPRRLPALALALALAGCGSTVAMTDTSRGASGNLGGNGSLSNAGGGPAQPDPLVPGPASQIRDGATPTRQPGVGGSHAPSSDPSVSGAAGPVLGATGRGFDAKTVRIGFNTLNNVSTFFNAVGAGDVSWGDMKADAEAIMADINARGGVLGRKLVGVFHDEDVAESVSNPSLNAQKTCTALTGDTTVVAAAINNTAGDDNDNFYSCMKKADTPFFTAIDSIIDDAWIAKYRGYLHSTQGPSINSLAPVFLDRLVALGYFSPWNTFTGEPGTGKAKLGLLLPDHTRGHNAATLLTRLAAARGISSARPFFYSTSSVGETSSQLQSAVLKFQTDDVTHVIAPEPSVGQFMVTAEQQQYRPRYGYLSTLQGSSLAQNAPARQLAGALGSGWQPHADSGRLPDSPAAKACLGALKRGGVDYGGSQVPTVIALYICDEIRLIAESIVAGGGFSTAALNLGLGRIGPGFQTAVGFRSGFSPTRADIVGAVRDVGFNSQCSCFRYLSSTLWPV